MVFQPRTLTTPHLGSRRLTLYYNLSLPPNLFILLFLDHLFSPLSYRLPIRSLSLSKPSHFTQSPPPLPVQSAAHLGVALTRHPPVYTSLRRSSLCPFPHACVFRLFPCRCAPPFVTLGLHPGPCQPLGISPIAGTSASMCPCLSLPELSSKYWHRRYLVSLLGAFSQKGERPGSLHSLSVVLPGPCSLRYLVMPSLSRPTSPPPHIPPSPPLLS